MNGLRLPRGTGADARRGCHVGRRRFLHGGRAHGAAGYEVVGITLQLYDHGGPRSAGRACRGPAAPARTSTTPRRVADTIGIPHYVLDYEDRFRTDVMDDFADAYLAGETPIPCVQCNARVKFRDLLRTAQELGADALATGHYVRRRTGRSGPELHRARGRARDQSYFSSPPPARSSTSSAFPSATWPRARPGPTPGASAFPFPTAGQPGHLLRSERVLCPGGGAASAPGAVEPGDIVDLDGRVLGRHGPGIVHFTVGQRRGIGNSAGEPLYVGRLEPDSRRVVVGPRPALLRDRLRVRDLNWLGDGDGPAAGERVRVKLRSTQPLAARAHPSHGPRHAEVVLDEAEPGVAPGQACVFYAGDRVLGGGWITRDG